LVRKEAGPAVSPSERKVGRKGKGWRTAAARTEIAARAEDTGGAQQVNVSPTLKFNRRHLNAVRPQIRLMRM
jgi:hypothetical protein